MICKEKKGKLRQSESKGASLDPLAHFKSNEKEEAERVQLAQATAGGKPLSEIVIEGRGPY